jgi:hypothetical protein
MSALHSLSATITIAACLPHLPLPTRMRRASILGFLFILGIYVLLPLTQRVVMPLQVQGTTVLINLRKPVQPLKRGQWTSYYLPNGRIAFARILGLPGETIAFDPDSFQVDGTLYGRLGREMPVSGQISLPVDAYFIWPDSYRTNYDNEMVTRMLRDMSIIKTERIIGIPFQRWFWRRQAFEPLVVLKRLEQPGTGK